MLATALSKEAVSDKVIATIGDVMTAQGLDAGAIAREARLADTLGLKSMDLAEIVLTLEDEFEADPFQAIPITSIRTVGDLVDAYLVTLGLAEAGAVGGQDMVREMAAAKARRATRRR